MGAFFLKQAHVLFFHFSYYLHLVKSKSTVNLKNRLQLKIL